MSDSSLQADFTELVALLERLRSPDGCPWDREQTHSSLKRFLLEEAHEVFEAIDQEAPQRLAEELGDVLLQVLFHAQIAREAGEFAIADVLTSLRDKLVRRHPHVFGDTKVKDAREVEANWERLKRREKGDQSILGHVPPAMPALAHSQLIQDRAATAGFEWEEMDGVLEKVAEEIGEIREASTDDRRAEEFGDLLMVLVNVGRWMGVNAEDALRRANGRFTQRFAEMERLASERSLAFADLPLKQKEALWQEAKGKDQATES
ncbi:MAG: nucleoside triphosphate pyrophosphohydrolase [Chloroflexi bacterium]|nr:nucleoside triphosphate pyrophosphohydrolase [Chloroflexota bacterium]